MSGLSLTIVSVCVTGKSCLKTELQFSDMYCLMAAHVYIDLWTETGESSLSLSLSPLRAFINMQTYICVCVC